MPGAISGTALACTSVIIPAHNRHESLQRAVASAAAELDAGDEVVVVDDASSPPINAAALSAGPASLRLVRCDTNGGAARARNVGVAAARCEFIAFLDSDDTWLPGKLDAQRRLLQDASAGPTAVACGWREVRDDGAARIRIPVASAARGDFFAGCWFSPGATLLLPRAVMQRCGPFDEALRRLEDYEWFLRFAAEGGRLRVADMVGAEIVRGLNARPERVEAAAVRIAGRLANLPAVTSRERRDCLAYLELERARAHHDSGDRVRTLAHLARSLAHRPRAGLPLRDWWKTPAAPA